MFFKIRSPRTKSVSFSVVTVSDEHRKRSVAVKCKKGYDLKAAGIFVILLSQDGFKSVSSERKS